MEVDEPESEPEPEMESMEMEWSLPENLTLNVDGKPANVFVVNAHSSFDTTDFSKLPEQTQKLATPFINERVNYVTLVEPGSICMGMRDLKEQYSNNIEKYLTHDGIFNLREYVHDMSSQISANFDPASSGGVKSQAIISNTGTNAVFLDFSSYRGEKVGLWDLSNMIAGGDFTPFENTDFLGVKLPNVPNGTRDGAIFASTLINMILNALNGPGRSRFNDVFFNTTVFPIMDMVIRYLASATPDFKLALPLSFISYFLALMTPPDNDIYIILTSCRIVQGMKYTDFFGPVTPATVTVEEQGALESLGALELQHQMEVSRSSSASLPSPELLKHLVELREKYNIELKKLGDTQAKIQLKQTRGDSTGLAELAAEARTEKNNLRGLRKQIQITRARLEGAGGGARGEGEAGGGARLEGGRRIKSRKRNTKKTRGRGNNKKTRGRRNAKGRGNNKKTRGRRTTTGRGNSKSRGKK